mgnify:CR=1 FL=1
MEVDSNNDDIDKEHNTVAGRLRTNLIHIITFVTFIPVFWSGYRMISVGVFNDQMNLDEDSPESASLHFNLTTVLGASVVLYAIAGICSSCLGILQGKVGLHSL